LTWLFKSGWRIRYNQELDRLIEGQDLVRFIKAHKLRWLGHVERMPETQMPKKILKGRLDNRRRRGHPRVRWMDSVIADLATMGIRGWKTKVADRDAWRTVVNEARAVEPVEDEEEEEYLKVHHWTQSRREKKFATTINCSIKSTQLRQTTDE
jgi:hypothetical protein